MNDSIKDILFQIFQELAGIRAAMERSNDIVLRMAKADVYEVRRDGDVEG